MNKLLFIIVISTLSSCKSVPTGCKEPHSFQCIFTLQTKGTPKDYKGSLSTLHIEGKNPIDDARRFAYVLEDCHKEKCWFGVNASKGKYFLEVIEQTKNLDKVHLGQSISDANAVIIVSKHDIEAYKSAISSFGLNANFIIHPTALPNKRLWFQVNLLS